MTLVAAIWVLVTLSKASWLFKMLGDALTSVPGIHTLRLYETVTYRNTAARTLPGLEYLKIYTATASGFGYYFSHDTNAASKTQWLETMVGLRFINLFVAQTRILLHGLFLNMIEESASVNPIASATPQGWL